MLTPQVRLGFMVVLITLSLNGCTQSLAGGNNVVTISACKIVLPVNKQPQVSASYWSISPERLVVNADKDYQVSFATTSPLSGVSPFTIHSPQVTYSINGSARWCATSFWPFGPPADCPYDFKLKDAVTQQDCPDPTIHVTK